MTIEERVEKLVNDRWVPRLLLMSDGTKASPAEVIAASIRAAVEEAKAETWAAAAKGIEDIAKQKWPDEDGIQYGVAFHLAAYCRLAAETKP